MLVIWDGQKRKVYLHLSASASIVWCATTPDGTIVLINSLSYLENPETK